MNNQEIIKNDRIIRFIFIFSIIMIISIFIIYHSDELKEYIEFNIYLLKIKLNLYNEY